jgi:hypothetical protein
VVFVGYNLPNRDLVDALAGYRGTVRVVGDAGSGRGLKKAIFEGQAAGPRDLAASRLAQRAHRKGTPLFLVETDKVEQEVEASGSGYLVAGVVGQTYAVGDVIGELRSEPS